MKKCVFVILGWMLWANFSFAQLEKNVAFTVNNFPNDKVKIGNYTKQIKKAESIFNKIDNNKLAVSHAQQVVSYLLGAASFNPKNAEVNYMLGLSYYWLKNYKEADVYLNRASQIESNLQAKISFYEGLNAYKNQDFDKSINVLGKFIENNENNSLIDEAKKWLLHANIAHSAINNPVVTKTETVKFLEAKQEILYPVISPKNDWIMYNKVMQDHKGKSISKIYWVKLDEQMKPESFPEELPMLNLMARDYQVVSTNSTGNKILLRAKDQKGKYDIYQSEWLVNQWSNPSILPTTINSVHDEIFASYAQNDSIIYVISDREEGYGGYDIWFTQKNRFGYWERVVNAGNVLNSPYDEITVVPDGTMLYVASNRTQSIGGFDIFRIRKKDGKWSRVVNLGYPVNTLENEVYFTPFIGKMQGLIIYADENNENQQVKRVFLPPPAKEPGVIFQELQLSYPKYISEKNVILSDE